MRYLLYTVAFLTLAPAATAQSPGPASQEHDIGWVTLDYCFAGYRGDLGATANLGQKRAYQVGYHVKSDAISGFTVRSVNVGLGRSLVGRWGRLAGFAGPAVSWGFDLRRSDGSGRFTTIGALANAQVIFTPVKEIGIGATFWGNLNSERSVGGLGVVLVFEGNK